LSGPKVGDLGDWRGEWIATGIPTPQEQQISESSPSILPTVLCIYLPIFVVGVLVTIFLFRLLAPYKALAFFSRNRSTKQQTTASALQRTSQRSGSIRENKGKPLSEYLATYTAKDKFFDLSFQIEESSRYLGECGITVAKVLDETSNQASALELWLFDAQGAQTISKILASNFSFNQTSIYNELTQIGQTILIQAGDQIVLETKQIKVTANVLQVEYDPKSPKPQNLFKKVVIQIKVWVNQG
jgi:hypothetical protein